MRIAEQGPALLVLLTFGAACTTDPCTNFYDVLNSVAIVLVEYDKTIIEVTGHTDSTGSDDYNQTLSENRALAVGSYPSGQGINSERVVSQGFGETMTAGDNATDEGRQQNRRVELRLVPLTA